MEKYKEIERSIIKKFRPSIWHKFVKAIHDYELIKENDKVAVCISGGKDSFLLAKCLEELQRHGKVKFDLEKDRNLRTPFDFYSRIKKEAR